MTKIKEELREEEDSVEETFQIPISIKYSVFPTEQQSIMIDIEDRLSNIEEKKYQKMKPLELNRSQKILVLKELGILDKILEEGLTVNMQAKLVSMLINNTEKNVKNAIQSARDDEKSIRTATNLKAIHKTFLLLGLKEKALKIENEIDKKGF